MIRAAVTLSKTVFVDVNERATFLKDTDVADKIFKACVVGHKPTRRRAN